MKKENENFQKMTLGGESYLLDRMSICGNLPKFANYFAIIQAANKQLKDAIDRQEGSKLTDSLTKKQNRLKLTGLSMDMIRKLLAYAGNENDNELFKAVNFSESDLIRSTDSNLCSISRRVLEAAAGQQADLTTYGITASMMTALQQATDVFYAMLPKVKLDKSQLKDNTIKLNNLIATLRKTWYSIDSLIDIVQTDEPDFYQEYQMIRKVERSRRTAIDLTVTAIEKQSGEAIALVNLSLMPADSLHKDNSRDIIHKKTAEKGSCRYKNLADGSYILTASKPGYKDTTVLTTIVSGERRIVSIYLERA